jgi:hypothetical protein
MVNHVKCDHTLVLISAYRVSTKRYPFSRGQRFRNYIYPERACISRCSCEPRAPPSVKSKLLLRLRKRIKTHSSPPIDSLSALLIDVNFLSKQVAPPISLAQLGCAWCSATPAFRCFLLERGNLIFPLKVD